MGKTRGEKQDPCQDANLADLDYRCRHFSRSASEDEIPVLLRLIADDLDSAKDLRILDVTFRINTSLDECVVSVYYYLDEDVPGAE